MVQQIITAFRAKHKFNLSNERLKAYAEKWQSKIEDENAIETFIDGLDIEPLEEIAKLDDALRVKAPKEPIEKQKDDEPQPNNDIQKQIDELKELLSAKAKSDLSATRLNELKDLPDELKASLEFMELDSLSEDRFNALKLKMSEQAEALKLAQSKTNPRFGVDKPNAQMSEEKAKEIANKI